MWSKISTYITKLSVAAKVGTAIIAFAVALTGGIVAYNKWVIKNYQEDQYALQRQQDAIELRRAFDTVMDSLTVLSTNVRTIKPKLIRIESKVDNLSKSHVNLLKQTKNVDLLIQYYEDEKKNKSFNEASSLLTPCEQKNIQIPLNIK